MAFVLTISTYAQKAFTVNNTSGTAADFSNLQEAIKQVNSGDTLYVQHSQISYGDIGIGNKHVKIIGRAGRDINYRPRVGDVFLSTGSDNSEISGLYVTGIINSDYRDVKNIKILNNIANGIEFGKGGSAEDILIQGNACDFVVLHTSSKNCIVSNNIISTTAIIDSGAQFTNNVLANPNGVTIENHTSTDLEVSNCIFLANALADQEVKVDNSANKGLIKFKNCLTYNYGKGKLTFATADNIEFENNQENVDPLFTKVNPNEPTSIAGESTKWVPVKSKDNLKLQESSPFSNACLYEGHNFSHLGLPEGVPSVKMSLESPTVDQNGKLKVTIQAQTN